MSDVSPLVFRVTARTLSPLHIGSGERMREGLDFIEHDGCLWIASQARLAETLVDEAVEGGMEIAQAVRFITGKTLGQLRQAGWLRDEHFDLERGLFRYRLEGSTSTSGKQGELHVQVKDVRSQPYVPGSSVKGALRSILMRHLAASDPRPPEVHREQRRRGRSRTFNGRVAARKVERRHFVRGSPSRKKDPNYDLWRAFRVLDSRSLEPSVLVLGHVLVLSAARQARGRAMQAFDVEAIGPGTTLTLGFEVDRWLFRDPRAAALSFSREDLQRFTTHLSSLVNAEAQTVLAEEAEFLRRLEDSQEGGEAWRFMQRLLQEAEAAGANEMILPVGRGTGWRNKTLGRVLLERLSPQEFDKLVKDFKLGRRRWRKDGPVPLTRQVARVGMGAAMPMGWLKVRMEPAS